MKYVLGLVAIVAAVAIVSLCGFATVEEIGRGWNNEATGISDYFALLVFGGLIVFTTAVASQIKKLRQGY